MIVFWSLWLTAGIALVIVFLCKIPSLLVRRMISAARGARDYGVLTANLQNGASILFEPSDAQSRRAVRYQIYQRNSRRKYFIGEWKRPLSSAEYTLYCYDINGKLCDILRVSELVNRKRYTKVLELPEDTDYIIFRITALDGVKVSEKKYSRQFFAWLALLIFSAAAVAAALILMFFVYMNFAVSETSEYWQYAFLAVAAVIAVSIIAFAVVSVCLHLSQREKTAKTRVKKKKRKRVGVISRAKYIFGGVINKFGNAFKSIIWKSPWRNKILSANDAAPNTRTLKRAVKAKDRK